MIAESTVKPSETQFYIEQISDTKCNVHMFDNVCEKIDEFGDKLYSYELYILKNISYHDKLGENIENYKTEWFRKAKGE